MIRLVVVASLATLGLVTAAAPGAGVQASRQDFATQARAVATEFFQTVNSRRYERTCDLMVRHVDRRLCVVGLRVGMLWSQSIRFRITEVRVHRDGAVVSALADGAPGRVLLHREGARYRVLRLEGR